MNTCRHSTTATRPIKRSKAVRRRFCQQGSCVRSSGALGIKEWSSMTRESTGIHGHGLSFQEERSEAQRLKQHRAAAGCIMEARDEVRHRLWPSNNTPKNTNTKSGSCVAVHVCVLRVLYSLIHETTAGALTNQGCRRKCPQPTCVTPDKRRLTRVNSWCLNLGAKFHSTCTDPSR